MIEPAADQFLSRPNPEAMTAEEQAEEQQDISLLDHILGWAAPDQKTGQTSPMINVLSHPDWTFKELLLALIIGSTPYTPMVMSRDNVEFSQYTAKLREELMPYLGVFGFDVESLTEKGVSDFDTAVQRSNGLRLLDRQQQRYWIGRGGYRVEGARTLSRLYDERGKKEADLGNYLAEMMICGELYNLIQIRSLFQEANQQPSNDEAERSKRLIPLHLEAALFLLEERLRTEPTYLVPQVLHEKWTAVRENVLLTHSEMQMSKPENVRLCSMFLKAKELYRSKEPAGSEQDWLTDMEEKELCTIIDNPSQNHEANTLWGAFCADVKEFLQCLAYRDLETANRLMEAKLRQEWHSLPEQIKDSLRRRPSGFPRTWLEEMGKMESPEKLLDYTANLKERAALLVGGLSRLAVLSTRAQQPTGTAVISLDQIATAVLKLRHAAGDKAPPIQLPPVYFESCESAARSAAALLIDEDGYLEKLCTVLKAGAMRKESIEQAAQHVDCPIEGVALGTHGNLNKVLDLAKRFYGVELHS